MMTEEPPKYRQPNRGVDIDPAKLARLREDRGWTQGQLADAAGEGVSGNTINKIERGQRRPSPATAEKLAAALGVEVSDLRA